MTASHNLHAYLLLIFTTLCWGLNAIISRLAVGEISPMQLVTVRWLGVVLILVVITRDNIVRDWPIMAVIFLREVFQMYHALALMLVLGGIWIFEMGKARPV